MRSSLSASVLLSGALSLSAASAVLGGCERERPLPAPPATLVLVPGLDSLAEVEELRVDPAPRSITRTRGRFVIELDPLEPGRVARVEPSEGCPVEVDGKELGSGARVERTLHDWFEFSRPNEPGQVGFGIDVTIRASPLCPEASNTRLSWSGVRGVTSPELGVEANGRVVRFRMPTRDAAEAAVEGRPRGKPGLLPISPRTRGEVELEARFALPGAAEGLPSPRASRRLQLASAAPASGLFQVATGTKIHLQGGPWELRVLEAEGQPSQGARLDQTGGDWWFRANRGGRYLLVHPSGRELTLRAAAQDEMPNDCGRSGCHGAIVAAARTSPMTHAFERLGHESPACALGCHTVGQRGVPDGGFSTQLEQHGMRALDVTTVDQEPHLSAFAGVGCLGCHGPAAIPAPETRDAILSTSVCATCHDQPPRYGHVAAWNATAMASGANYEVSNEASPEGGRQGACAACHTTRGFLGVLDGRENLDWPEHSPDQRKTIAGGDASAAGHRRTVADAPGLGCATCHDPHPVGVPASAGLLREVALDPSWDDSWIPSASRSCVGCHSPSVLGGAMTTADHVVQSAGAWTGPSSAAVWAGRFGVDPQTGSPLQAKTPHLTGFDGGCTDCHAMLPEGVKVSEPPLERGRSHGFAASGEACVECHGSDDRRFSLEGVREASRVLHEQARVLLKMLGGAATSGHGLSPLRQGEALLTERSRRVHNLALLLDDPAPAAHNPAFARLLLESAQ